MCPYTFGLTMKSSDLHHRILPVGLTFCSILPSDKGSKKLRVKTEKMTKTLILPRSPTCSDHLWCASMRKITIY